MFAIFKVQINVFFINSDHFGKMKWAHEIFLLCAISFCVLHASSQKIASDNNETKPMVATQNGKVIGKIFYTIDKHKKFYAFRSIPYAKPPTGSLRFKAPQPIGNWSKIINGTKDPPSCMQLRSDANNKSEDCLYLNVYTTCLKGNKAVIVWIHGGFFIAGSGSKSSYSPDYLLNEDVVVVSINYRVGVFGFLSTKDDVAPGNYAIKDQILALKWIKSNVYYFGGDPNQITVYGESAGAASVSVLVSASAAKGLFNRAIISSGVNLCLWSRSINPKLLAFQIGSSLGIVTNSSQELIDGLRKVDAQDLLFAGIKDDAITTVLTNPRDGLFFAPTIEPPSKEAVATNFNHEHLKNGNFNQVPLLVGFNSAEGNPFKNALTQIPLFLTQYDLNNAQLVPIDMNVVDESDAQTIGRTIKLHYFGLGLIFLSTTKLGQYITDDQFVRPTYEYVRLTSKRVKTYFYQFSYEGQLPNVTRNAENPGVGHGEDLDYIWNTGKNNATEKDLVTRSRLVRLWTNFAKFGNTTPIADPILQNVTWQPSDPNNLNYLDIGENLTMKNMIDEPTVEFWKKMYNTYGNPSYDTY